MVVTMFLGPVVVVAAHLVEVVVLEASQELGEEAVDGDDRFIGQIGEVERIVQLAHGVTPVSVSSRAAATRGRFRSGKHLQVELLIEGGDLALGGTHEQLTGHGDKDAVVPGGVIDEGVTQLCKRPGVTSGDLKKAC